MIMCPVTILRTETSHVTPEFLTLTVTMIGSIKGWALGLLDRSFDTVSPANMKVTRAAILGIFGGVSSVIAQGCPDYTTYAQVRVVSIQMHDYQSC